MGNELFLRALDDRIYPLRAFEPTVMLDGGVLIQCDDDNRRSALCRICKQACSRRDHLLSRIVRDVDQNEITVFLKFAFPRVECREHGIVMAYQNFFEQYSSFTIAFEEYALSLVADGWRPSQLARSLQITRPILDRILKRAYRRRRIDDRRR